MLSINLGRVGKTTPVRGRDVIGRTVWLQTTGRRLGRVVDLLLDPGGRRVVGLAVADGGPGGPRMLPLDAVTEIGRDAILAGAAAQPVPPAAVRTWRELRELAGKPVVSSGGRELGAVDDVVFDLRTGEVSSYRLSGGFVQDLIEGRPEVPAASMVIGSDAVLADGVGSSESDLDLEG